MIVSVFSSVMNNLYNITVIFGLFPQRYRSRVLHIVLRTLFIGYILKIGMLLFLGFNYLGLYCTINKDGLQLNRSFHK